MDGVRVVALTGGIGSGKSTVEAMLASRGAIVIDADVLAREVVAPGTEGLAEVVASFGAGVLAPDAGLDRPALARLVFGDPAARQRLEAIIHPRVRRRTVELTQEVARTRPGSVVIHSVPLLYETDRARTYDEVVVVDCSVATQVDRLVAGRGMTEADARARIGAQATREQRLAIATQVIGNDGSLDELTAEVDRVWRALNAPA